MKKLLFILLGAMSFQFIQAQAPINTPDNIGAGNCLQFDGTNDYVAITDHSSLHLTGNISMEAWFRSRGADPLDIWIGAKNACGFIQDGTGGAFDHRVYWNLRNVGFVRTNTLFTDDTWHHIAASYDGSTMKIYVDGVLESQKSASGVYDMNSGNLFFGVRSDFVNYANITLEEFRIWNVARTQTEIRDNMCKSLQGNESGLVGYWNMNEGTGSAVNDLTSNNNHGTRQ